MALPQWNDPALKLGTMARTALWLIAEVGIGNVFTKDMHRKAFVGVAQADRRMRDLRQHGWTIATSLDDASLLPNEQRLVRIGTPVWDAGARRTRPDTTVLSGKKRMTVLADHHFQCSICGIAGGEAYPDVPALTAQLLVSRRTLVSASGNSETMHVSECKRCHDGANSQLVDLEDFEDRITALSDEDRAVFLRWADIGRIGPLEALWIDFRRLPQSVKAKIVADYSEM